MSNSPNVRLIPFGKSYNGRVIPAFVISDFATRSDQKARVLLLAGQHGDEPSPVWSVLSLCGKLASGSNPDLLKKCVLIVTPIANPDGFASRSRLNGQGRDINRDWAILKTPEAQFVHQIIKTWRPHLMIDTHEWTRSTLTSGNEIECPPTATRTQWAAMMSVARRVESRSALAAVQCNPKGNT
ncbi:MAG: M14 family zinc carboxypeptidase, partial [Armatimonadetes bacterium]|nr:M14 family zinc carboxypeptidase [Armatimonadota bacterium]